MKRTIILAAVLLSFATPARANICHGIALAAYQAAERRDYGLGQDVLIRSMVEAEHYGNERLARVWRAMLRDIPNDRTLSPRAAYERSRLAPCGWPDAAPR